MGRMLDKLTRAIEARQDALISLTQDLIRFPTINPPGDAYTPCAEYLGERLRGAGFSVVYERGEGAPGDCDAYPRTNMLARREGRAAGRCVHFNGHIDVVPAGAGWTWEPFAGSLHQGRIYGRGACDMKGGLAAAIIAVEAFLEVYPDFSGAVEISATVDEESGGFGGVAHLARRGYFSKPRVDHVIIPEPLNKDRICLGHRGVWWAKISTFGHTAHGSMPFLGTCAIRHMGAILNGFETQLLPKLRGRHSHLPIEPRSARRSTMNINSVHGGAGEGYGGLPVPMVADLCEMIIDRRFLPEENLDEVRAEVISVIETAGAGIENFRYKIEDVMDVLPTLTARDAPVVKAIAASIADVLHKQPDYIISPGSYDQKHIVRLGALRDCIAYGPGILELAHQPDEYVAVNDMMDAAKVMALAIHRLLVLPEPQAKGEPDKS